MNNLDIRNAISQAKVKYWEVAKHYGLSDGNFSRKLRNELSEAEKQKIFDIISKLKA